jgi:predicted alpha/beta hydrolase family esterase
MTAMRPILIIPGFGNSGPDHWQSRWERTLPVAQRIELGDWDCPVRASWVARIDTAVRACAVPPVLVAHSLGVIAVAWWAGLHDAPVHSALLVAPPDVAQADLPSEVRAFGAPPQARLRFPSVLAASSGDPFCDLARARALAEGWGARLIVLGDVGHVNTASGHGPWPQGERLLAELLGTG